MSNIQPWETDWTVFGPIHNPGNSATWPGELGWDPLPLDGATEVPESVTIRGQELTARQVRSDDGRLPFTAIFEVNDGCPVAYAMTVLDAPEDRTQPLTFSALWATEWWLNGESVYHTHKGNPGAPDDRTINQMALPLKAGRNLLVVRVLSGQYDQWSLSLGWPVGVASDIVRAPLPANPVKRTPTRDYAQAGLRIEHRPTPEPVEITAPREAAMAAHGVEAHWIGVVLPGAIPVAPSCYLPGGQGTRPEHQAMIKAQVEQIHANGMAAITWFPGNHCQPAAAAHPEWQTVTLEDRAETGTEDDYNLCIRSPYGEALIGFVLESMQRYGFDGFWFDGTTRSAPGTTGCLCDHCRAIFEADTGLALPTRRDWEDPVFCRWVAWRYQDYMRYWGRLAARVRQRFPHARIVVNHRHRLSHPWEMGTPLGRYEADIVAGTESQHCVFTSAFHSRLHHAYRQPEAEVWMGMHHYYDTSDYWPAGMSHLNRYLHHAMATLTAGCMPSFGTPHEAADLTDAYDAMSALINPRQSLAGGESLAQAGVLISQQSETFVYSRGLAGAFPHDYWHSVVGWHHLLMENQITQDLIFDEDLTDTVLPRYDLVILPQAAAISEAQLLALRSYAESGGKVVIDQAFATHDEWGFPVEREATLPAIRVDGNPGLAFHSSRDGDLRDRVMTELKQHLRPKIETDGPPRLHLAWYRHRGRLLLHVHNFIAWSESASFPNPQMVAPPVIENLTLHIRCPGITQVRSLLPLPRTLPARIAKGRLTVQLPELEWGNVLELT